MVIVDDVENPFPRYTVTESTVRPYPVILINYEGEVNNLLVKAEPAPGYSCKLENHISHFKSKDQNYLPKYIGKIIVFEVLQIMDAGRADGEPIQLDFSLYSIDGSPTLLCKKRSPIIKVFNHSQYLPAPDIVKLVPEYCLVNEKVKVDAFGPLFLRKNNILECQLSEEDGKEFKLLKDKDIIRKRNCFHNFTFNAPIHDEGAVLVRARYKNRDFGSGKIFFYISEPAKVNKHSDDILIQNNNKSSNNSTQNTETHESKQNEQENNINYYSYNGKYEGLRYELMMIQPDINYLNKQDKYGMTCLHYAVLGGNIKCVRILLEKGANPNIISNFSETPLHIACRLGLSDIVNLLLEYEAKVETRTKISPLHLASLSGNCNIVQSILDAEDFGESIIQYDHDMLTPLHYAVFKGQYKVVNLLLNYSIEIGEDLLIGDSNKMTPLHWAVALGEIECVREFLAVCDERQINLKDTSGRTALFYSVLCPNIEICRELLSHNADSNAQDNIQETPLFSAVSINDDTIVALLLEYGADPNILNANGEKPFKSSDYNIGQESKGSNSSASDLHHSEISTSKPTPILTLTPTPTPTPTLTLTPTPTPTPTPTLSEQDFEEFLKYFHAKSNTSDVFLKIPEEINNMITKFPQQLFALVAKENESLKSTIRNLESKVKSLEEKLESFNLKK